MGQADAPRRILIVDDNQDSADILAAVLSLRGHDASIAYSGSEGLCAAAELVPDVIFLDLGMPGMDGYQVAAALRRMSGLEHVFIVAYTAWNDAATRARVAEAGFNLHLTKTATLEALLAAVHGTPAHPAHQDIP